MELKTERLYIRPVRIEDKEAMFRYRSDLGTNKYLSLVPQSVEDVALFIEKTSPEINVPGADKEFRGKGYATEALKIVIDHLINSL